MSDSKPSRTGAIALLIIFGILGIWIFRQCTNHPPGVNSPEAIESDEKTDPGRKGRG